MTDLEAFHEFFEYGQICNQVLVALPEEDRLRRSQYMEWGKVFFRTAEIFLAEHRRHKDEEDMRALARAPWP